jgi:hypothetical protein
MAGLPGYDDYLDNYGNPGMGAEVNVNYPRWAIEERIYVTQVTKNPDTYKINRKDGIGEFTISFREHDRRLLINGEDVDLGDDFIEFISIIDDFHEDDVPLGEASLQQPYDGDPDVRA